MLLSLASTARINAQPSLGLDSTPVLKVFVYSFAGLSPSVLQGAETEAVRILRPVPVQIKWIDCISHVVAARCMSPDMTTDLIVRLTAKALPQAGARALGIAGSSADYAAAFIFYDRILALRSQTRFLPIMLGRVMAHEITHLLIPQEHHAEFGLRRGQWSADDLDFVSSASIGLSPKSLQLMQKEALRRVLMVRRRNTE